MKVFNTLTRDLEEFTPLEGDQVRMYTCGPTVYDYAHIGNFRAYIFEDILRRHLEWSGFTVKQVMNLTDVDDKTIRGAKEAGVSLNEFTATFKDAFFNDLKALNIESAEIYPAATDHVGEMIELVERLFDAGYAYKSDDGSVYFNVGKFDEYGKLSHLDISGMAAGARVAQDEYDKENVADFALWKAWDEEDGEVVWDSPWGRGRPGWHLECSAMSMKYLGETFDLHTGGIDNMFPHHENEVAQSEAATGRMFVKYWMHCGYLLVDGAKMSKSLGNFYTIRQISDKGYSGRDIRYVLISGQYRQQFNFTFDALSSAKSSLSRLDEFYQRLEDAAAESGTLSSEAVPEWADDGRKTFREAMDDDLNMPEALAALFDMIRVGNKALDAGEMGPSESAAVLTVMDDLDRVLGLGRREALKPDAEIVAFVEQRQRARDGKDWAESDRIRDELAGLGWVIKDTSEGPQVTKL